jgi:hypothetical protein
MMIAENVHVLWDEMPGETDFIDALANLYDEDNREWLWEEFLDAPSGCKESYLLEYVEFFGADELFYKALQMADPAFSKDFLMNVLEIGVEEDDLPMIFGRYGGTLSGEEIIKILNFYDLPEEYAKVIFGERIEGDLPYNQIYMILDRVDEKLYPFLRPHIKKLPFSKRMDLMDVFDIDL